MQTQGLALLCGSVCGQREIFHLGACSGCVSAVKPCSCTSAVLPQPGGRVPGAVSGAGVVASPLLSTWGMERKAEVLGSRLQLAHGPTGALASWHRQVLPALV